MGRRKPGELPRACSHVRYTVTRLDCQRPARRHGLRKGSCRGDRRTGADGGRTHDLRLAKPALSQLSYSPGTRPYSHVGPGRVELPTLPLSGVRSSQLSYGPAFPPKGGAGTELDSPASRSLKTR